jgi:glycerol-3-phosphate dehydrogenase (NAD(P)+)
MNVGVLGAGAWGSALAKIIHDGGHTVTLWDIDAPHLATLATGRNDRYLPGIELPRTWRLEPELARAALNQDCLVFALPSVAFRSVARQIADTRALLVSVTKGIEYDSGLTMCRILREHCPNSTVAALSGPSFAAEVVRGIPTAIVGASDTEEHARTVQTLFHRPTFRVYRSTDVLGVELGGALKNIIAIAAGVGDGLGYGDNTKAAVVTRALAEMRRLGTACGALPETFGGLSGLGDLTLTCFSRQSRNRELGERLGRGESMEQIMAASPKLAEGYPTARSAHRLARQLGVSTPIIDEVHAMLYLGKNVRKAEHELLARGLKAED